MQHELKILPEFFGAWKRGEKTCELRKDDRGFMVGDTLTMRCGAPASPVIGGFRYDGRELTVRVLGILRDHEGLAPGYCLMSCEEVKAAVDG